MIAACDGKTEAAGVWLWWLLVANVVGAVCDSSAAMAEMFYGHMDNVSTTMISYCYPTLDDGNNYTTKGHATAENNALSFRVFKKQTPHAKLYANLTKPYQN